MSNERCSDSYEPGENSRDSVIPAASFPCFSVDTRSSIPLTFYLHLSLVEENRRSGSHITSSTLSQSTLVNTVANRSIAIGSLKEEKGPLASS